MEKNNELNSEIEIPNTVHHKMIVKSRNEFYKKFKERFEGSFNHIVEFFDKEREEETKFNDYWNANVKELEEKSK
jgi:hypothetical protein